ncbi:MAG: hypothetical protein ACK5ME_12430 [Parahaliea sp.]
MAQNKTRIIGRDQFLHIAVNLIYKTLLEAGRAEAKTVFRDLARGRVVPLTRVQMEDGSLVQFDLGFDHSEYRGDLNFGSFRKSLTELIAHLSDVVREQHNITVFSAENDPNVLIFGITGISYEEQEPSLLVLAADAGLNRPSVLLKLMYLDYRQFVDQGAAAGEEVEDDGYQQHRASR